MKIIYCLMALLCHIATGLAQPEPAMSSALNIGDKIPVHTFKNLYNSPASTFSIDDYRGKLVIIDFWSTWCGACLESLPKMQSLQKQFKKDLKVVMVNDQEGMTDEKLKAFFEKRKATTGFDMQLLTIFADTALKPLFPHQTLPHCAWIDKDGKLAAITFAEDVNAENIMKMLAGKGEYAIKKNDALLFDKNFPLLTGRNGAADHFLYRSILAGPIENIGAPGGMVQDDNGNITRYYEANSALMGLFITAYPEVFKHVENRIITEAEVNFKALYSYELITPPIAKAEFLKDMQEDLYRYFHVIAKKEIREVKCYAAIANENIKKSFSTHDTASKELHTASLKKFLYYQSIDEFLKRTGGGLDRPVFNETEITQKIDIDLPSDIDNYTSPQLRQFYYEKGLTLLETTRKLEVAVLTRAASMINPSTTFTKQ